MWRVGAVGPLAFSHLVDGIEHHLSESHDAEVRLSEQLARAVGDEPLAVGDGRILLQDTSDAGEMRRAL